MLTNTAWPARVLRVLFLSSLGGVAIYYAQAETQLSSAEGNTPAQTRKQELEKRFRQHSRFACDYQEKELGLGGPHTVGKDGKQRLITHDVTGRIVFQDFTRLRLDLTTQHHTYDSTQEIHVVADGRHAWYWETYAKDGKPTETPIKVNKDQIVMSRLEISPEERRARLRGELMPDPPYRLSNSFRRLYALHPLYGIQEKRLEFVGEEILDGETVWHFSVQPFEYEGRSEHWIGAKDGVPRKIEIYNYTGTNVTTTIELLNVEHDLKDVSRAFVYQEQHQKIIDREAARAEETERIRQVKEQYGHTLEERMYRNTVSFPDFKQARDVRYDGIFAMSHDYYLRFEVEGEVRFVEEDNLKPHDPEEAADWFRQVLPDDAKHLAVLSDLECRFDDSDPDGGTWILRNRKSNVYFFRSWHAW